MTIKTWEERLEEMAHFDQTCYEEDSNDCKLAEIDELRAELEKQLELSLNSNIDKLMALSDEQVRALCAFEGHHPDDEAKLAKQAFDVVLLKRELTAVTEECDMHHRVAKAAIDDVTRLKTELAAIKAQEPVGVVNGGGHLWTFEGKSFKDGDKMYLAGGAKPAPITREQVRSAGGIVHADGNVFFTSLEQLNELVNGMKP